MNLFPIEGTWVTRQDQDEPGIVQKVRLPQGDLCVKWLATNQREWLTPNHLRSGFQVGICILKAEPSLMQAGVYHKEKKNE